jgi:hypothetical protein
MNRAIRSSSVISTSPGIKIEAAVGLTPERAYLMKRLFTAQLICHLNGISIVVRWHPKSVGAKDIFEIETVVKNPGDNGIISV